MSVETEGYEKFFKRSNSEYESLLEDRDRKVDKCTSRIRSLEDEIKKLTSNNKTDISNRIAERDSSIIKVRQSATKFAGDQNSRIRDERGRIKRSSENSIGELNQEMEKRIESRREVYDEDLMKILKDMKIPLSEQRFSKSSDLGKSVVAEAIHEHLLGLVEDDFNIRRMKEVVACKSERLNAVSRMKAEASAYGNSVCEEISSEYGLNGPSSELESRRNRLVRASVEIDDIDRKIDALNSKKFNPSVSISDIPVKEYGGRTESQITAEAYGRMDECRAMMDSDISGIQDYFDRKIKAVDKDGAAELEKISDECNSKVKGRNSEVEKKISKLQAECDKDVQSLKKQLEANIANKNGKIEEARKDLSEIKSKYNDDIAKFLEGFSKEIDEFRENNDPSIEVSEGFECGTQVKEFIPLGYRDAGLKGCALYEYYKSRCIDYGSGPWGLDLRNGGNLLIRTSPDVKNDDQLLIDSICGMFFKFVEEFPAGSVRLHVVDYSKNNVFHRLNSIVLRNISREMNYITDYQTSLSPVFVDIENSCNRISGKLYGDIRDMFDLYEVDKTEQFNIVFIRRGLSEIVKGSNDSLTTLNSLVTRFGMDAGVRFIMVDDFEYDGDLDQRKLELVDDIRANFQTVEYSPDGFVVDGRECKLVSIDADDEIGFIERVSKIVCNSINNSQKNLVTYQDVGFGKVFVEKESSNVLRIPIGKCGNDVYELALNCAGGDPSNIGYTFIGRSGSGKSAIFRSVVLNAAMKYSPDDVMFYLLDFKNGNETKNYEDNKIPHIKYLSKKNESEDAYCLFTMIRQEIDHRGSIFKEISDKNGINIDNLYSYNNFVDSNPEMGKHMPRILVVIDEIQRIFLPSGFDDMQEKTATLLGEVASLGRFAGVHLIIIAQNLSGKASKLHDHVLNNVAGRGMFMLEDNLISDSGFGPRFNDLRSSGEIAGLKKGELYISTDGNPVKVKVAFADKLAPIKDAIHNKYIDYKVDVSVIGDNSVLHMDHVSSTGKTYKELIASPKCSSEYGVNNGYSVCIGEDCFTVEPQYVDFKKGSGKTLVLGNDMRMSGSIMANMLTGVGNVKDSEIFVCNGSGKKEIIFNGAVSSCEESGHNLHKYALRDIERMVKDVYAEYVKRSKEDEQESDSTGRRPLFVFVHDMMAISALAEDKPFSKGETKPREEPQSGNNSYLAVMNVICDELADNLNNENLDFNGRTVLDVLKDLYLKGPIHEMYVIVSSMSESRNFNDFYSNANNIFLINELNDTQYLLKRDVADILTSAVNKDGPNSVAISIMNNYVSKFRPVMDGSDE